MAVPTRGAAASGDFEKLIEVTQVFKRGILAFGLITSSRAPFWAGNRAAAHLWQEERAENVWDIITIQNLIWSNSPWRHCCGNGWSGKNEELTGESPEKFGEDSEQGAGYQEIVAKTLEYGNWRVKLSTEQMKFEEFRTRVNSNP